MNILLDMHLYSGLLMVGLPIALGIYLTRRFRLGWRLWWIGAATFVLSQVGHIPFNILVPLFIERVLLLPPLQTQSIALYALFLGLSAGLWEELSRAAVYRWWADDARSWRKGVLMGAGHGGIEAIILGLLVLGTFVYMAAIRSVDLSTIVPPVQMDLARQQISAYWSAPWHLAILGTVERVFTIPFHITLSVMVLQAFTRRQWWWVALAVIWHAAVDALIVYLSAVWAPFEWRPYAVEGVIALSALISLVILFTLRRPEPVETPPAEVVVPPPLEIKPESLKLDATTDNLDNSRFSE